MFLRDRQAADDAAKVVARSGAKRLGKSPWHPRHPYVWLWQSREEAVALQIRDITRGSAVPSPVPPPRR